MGELVGILWAAALVLLGAVGLLAVVLAVLAGACLLYVILAAVRVAFSSNNEGGENGLDRETPD